MRPVLRVLHLLILAAPAAMARGAALSVVVMLAGAALLGLSGWFITATGIAGLAGIGIAFDVFRPSAGVRMLALGRTAARYGERLFTHDATLRALAALRVTLLRHEARRDGRALERLRGETTLTRIVADVDALDGLVLRVFLPVLAALVTHATVFAALGFGIGWPVAWAIAGVYLPLSALVLWRLARRGRAPSEAAEAKTQALRRGMIDLIRDREARILAGRLGAGEDALLAVDAESRAAARLLDRTERDAEFLLNAIVALAVAAALLAGGWLIGRGSVGPAAGAIGLFVALALAETVLPLRRGFAELGRMTGAARRVAPGSAPAATTAAEPQPDAPLLQVTAPLPDLCLAPGQALALTGPSGAGKTTLLMQLAGLAPSENVTILGLPPRDWDERALRDIVTMVPQRSGLIAGTIRENLALAAAVPDDAMWTALDAVDLAGPLRARGGLGTRLGEGGSGLSGGQARRLSLARAILRKPRLLLLDEPTEGLDAATAARVLDGLRRALPQAAILATLHRDADHRLFDRRVALTW